MNNPRFQPIQFPRVKAPRESAVQKAVAHYLNLVAGSPKRPNFMWWHTANGEARPGKTGAILAGMGVLPGVWDIQIMAPVGGVFMNDPSRNPNDTIPLWPRPYFIELKRPTPTGTRRKPIESHLGDDQVAFRDRLIGLGVPAAHFAVHDSVDGVAAQLKAWGIV